MSDPDDAEITVVDPLAEAFEASPDLMRDPVHRQRHAAMRARLFGETGHTGRFGRYQLERRLGAGAMGVVHVAHDPVLDRRVALKILRDPGGIERARLLREAQAVAQVSHPNVVEVFEVGEADRGGSSEAFIALELVEGPTLRAWTQERPRSWSEVVEVYAQAGRGLAAAHAHGLVHRDFKPDNVMIGPDGRVRVLDFGLARATGHALEVTEGAEPQGTLDDTLTRTGAIAGTPAYMAPELFAGATADARSDQVALAISIYEAIYGERPFAGGTIDELIEQVRANRRHPWPAHPRVPRSLMMALDRALAPTPADRWPSVAAFVDALETSVRRSRRRRHGLGVGVLLAGSLLAALGLWTRERAPATAPAACQGGASRLSGVWDPSRREALQAKWHLPDGTRPPSAASIVAGLDERAASWITAWDEVCEGLRGADDLALDVRARCLEQRRDELGGLVDALDDVPVPRLRRALPLVDALPRDACATDDDGFPLPPEPERAREVETVLAQLRRASQRCVLAGPRDCGEAMEAGLARARALEHPPLLAYALQQSGALEDQRGRPAAAEVLYEEAFFLARAGGQYALAAKIATNLVDLVGYRGRRSDEGERWVRQAEAMLANLPPDHHQRGDLLNNRALLQMSTGRTKDAERDYLAAIEVYEHAPHAPPDAISTTLGNLAQVAYEERDLERAIAQLDRALALRIEHRGPQHPSLLSVLNNRALVHMERGDLPAAALDLQRALEIGANNLGNRHLELSTPLSNLAQVYALQRDWARARERYAQAAELLADVLDPEHPQRLNATADLATIDAELGDVDRALETLTRVLHTQQVTPDVSPMSVAETHLSLGRLLLRTERAHEAEPHLQQALAATEHERGPDHPTVAKPLSVLGEALLARGDAAAALPRLERAWALREAGPGLATERADTAFALARALVAARPSPDAVDRARSLAEEAHHALAEAGPAFADDERRIAGWLAALGSGEEFDRAP